MLQLMLLDRAENPSPFAFLRAHHHLTEEYALVWPSTFLYRDPFEHDGSQLSVSAVTFDSRGSKELASVLWP